MALYNKECVNYNSSGDCQKWQFSGDLFYWDYNAETLQTQTLKYQGLSKDQIETIYEHEFVGIYAVFIFLVVMKIFRIVTD